MSRNRITERTPDGATDSHHDYVFSEGRLWSLITPGHSVELGKPKYTHDYNCECDACSNCLPEIDLDKLAYGDNVEPLDRERNCDDESR